VNDMLGRKQSISNDDWIKAMANIKTIIAEADIKKLEKAVIAEIKTKTRGKKAAYAWSAGKDSIVLGAICEKAGVKDCMIGVCNLEYPAFLAWIEKHKPAACEVINTGQDMSWLVKHPQMLFPDSTRASQWFTIVQHRAQTKYVREHKIDVLLLGRRKADGNYVGKGDNIYTAKGIARYSPLSEWTHEQLLAYIAYNNLPLPPIYDWPNGYKCGTHPWPARQHVGNHENGWREISSIDPTLIEEAAKAGITSAIKFLEVGHDNQRKTGESDTGGK